MVDMYRERGLAYRREWFLRISTIMVEHLNANIPHI
jgi:hypothetical protein